jgi:hypothetical protein
LYAKVREVKVCNSSFITGNINRIKFAYIHHKKSETICFRNFRL